MWTARKMLAALLLVAGLHAQQGSSSVVYATPLQAITAAQTSAPIRNIGQSMRQPCAVMYIGGAPGAKIGVGSGVMVVEFAELFAAGKYASVLGSQALKTSLQ